MKKAKAGKPPMKQTRPFEASDVQVKVQVPEVFVMNVQLRADMELYRSISQQAMGYVLQEYLNTLCGVPGACSTISAVLEQGLLMYLIALDMGDMEQEDDLPEWDRQLEVTIPEPLLHRTLGEMIDRGYAEFDPSAPGFVLGALTKQLCFHPIPDRAIDFKMVVAEGLAHYDAALVA